MLSDQTYSYESPHVYKEHNIRLSQSSKLQSRVVIGADTFVGDGTSISGSVIGRNCHIGHDVTIENSYIWDGAVIGDGCIVRHSIVAAGAEVRSNAMLNSGSVIGFGVVIDKDVIVPNETKIVKTPIKTLQDSAMFMSSSEEESENDDDDEDDVNPLDSSEVGDANVVGAHGVGFLYEEEEDDEETNKGYSGIMYQMAQLNVSDVSVASTTVGAHQYGSKRKKRTYSTNSMYVSGDEDEEEEEEDFHKEALATVERAMENNHDIDTALLELNTLRMSMNVTYHEVRLSTSTALVERVDHFIATDTLGVKDAVDKVFGQWSALFKRQVFEDLDQVDLLLIVQKLCCQLNESYRSMVFLFVLMQLYDAEVVEEDNVYLWWNGKESQTEEMSVVRDKAEKWIEWLQQAESDSEEDSDEDDE
ncbi:unnamed protein product [Ambrosiozyma monospora]|uniref:Unnamed protein product n=1 Tax=Ambrosiozyma monospora TaxID=43982 RepID=A0ACB5TBQ4_AMBMO|nr:unnamed protein product [Ambrosiozyma monospora]